MDKRELKIEETLNIMKESWEAIGNNRYSLSELNRIEDMANAILHRVYQEYRTISGGDPLFNINARNASELWTS